MNDTEKGEQYSYAESNELMDQSNFFKIFSSSETERPKKSKFRKEKRKYKRRPYNYS